MLKDSTRIIALIQDIWLICPMVSLVLTISYFVSIVRTALRIQRGILVAQNGNVRPVMIKLR